MKTFEVYRYEDPRNFLTKISTKHVHIRGQYADVIIFTNTDNTEKVGDNPIAVFHTSKVWFKEVGNENN